MKLIAMLLLALGCATSAVAVELPQNLPRVRWTPNLFYAAEGFRLGYIMRVEQNLLFHFEGKFMMGFGSSPSTVFDAECRLGYLTRIAAQTDAQTRAIMTDEMNQDCFIDENPWLFSIIDRSVYDQFGSDRMVPVVVYYTTPVMSVVGAVQNFSLRPLISRSLNYVHTIVPVDPNSPAPRYFSLEAGERPVASSITPAEGFIEGRVVKASLDHHIRKAYEITVQQGRYGNNFIRMNANSAAIYDHLVLSMLTGQPVRLGYVRLFKVVGWFSSIISAYSTNYRVVSVEILPDNEAPRLPEGGG